MSKQLPERPDLGQLKKQAKDLLDQVHAGDEAALRRAEIGSSGASEIEAFALHDAQRVIARDYGFGSWAKLKLHVETRQVDAAEARLIHAALEEEREAVDAILEERPALRGRSIFVAAALGDAYALARELQSAPLLAKTKGGPRGWEPLLYLCFGRCGGSDVERERAARLLLERGADPNASWFHPDWPESPLSALYGATGVNDFPELARVLLRAGANPNDGESRYHAAEHHHVACLEVLREFGADFSGADATWGTTPLCFLLGWSDPTPAVRQGLRWLLEQGADPNVRSWTKTSDQTALHTAIVHGWEPEMVELLLNHGADPNMTRADGRTAYALAVMSGRDDLVALLQKRGAAADVPPRDVFLGACMRGDAAFAQRVLEANPGVLTQLSSEDRKLSIVAAKKGLAGTLELLGQFGFDLASEGEWGEQPLHWAAWHGQADAVRALIARGVPLNASDRRFGAPPTGWCAHGSQFAGNPAGKHAAALELLIAAGAFVAPDTNGSAEIMAVLKKHGLAGKRPCAP